MSMDTDLVTKKFKVIGTRPARPDGIDKVTGRARYGADATAPGMLIALVLRSPHPHAIIKKIDISKAEKLAGVKAVITSADLKDHTNGDRGMMDILENCMARKKVYYDGHAVAAVAAAFSVQAESNIVTAATGALTANAKLDFRITVPRILFLRVGTSAGFVDSLGGANLDRVDFALTAADLPQAGSHF